MSPGSVSHRVLGPSGLEFCKAALTQGHSLTLYVRSPDKLPAEITENANVSVVKGSLEDVPTFQQAATSGPTVFVSFAGPTSNSKGTVRQQIGSLNSWFLISTEALERNRVYILTKPCSPSPMP
jgi:putative NADH-flavin reductase